MSYIALARKWRPRTFAELIGQEHVTQALINSLTRDRLHHAYLFNGTRGVGKTSIARLLAKAINCEHGPSPEPCLTCDTCLAIEQGRYIDLIEIDAASKTRVEDTRELLDNVSYTPTQGRFKVYLIDEVHMLSTHSFNALLKTLEEPPAHVKFLLATTEPQKLPMTVLSRCLQFHLKPLPPALLQQHLAHILTQENLSFDGEALQLIAKAAEGSVRDALSLLDQIIALGDGSVQTDAVKRALGYTHIDYTFKLLQALGTTDAAALLEVSKHIAKEGGQYQYVLDELLTQLHQLSILQALPKTASIITSIISTTPELLELSQHFTPEDTQLLYQIALKGAQDMSLAPTLAVGFEMTLLRMHTFRPASSVTTPALAYQQTTQTAPTSTPALVPATTPIKSSKPDTPKTQEKNTSVTPSKSNTWAEIIPQLKLTGLALNAAQHAEFKLQPNHTACLRVGKNHRPLFTANVIEKLEGALTRYYAKPIKLALQHDEQQPDSPAEQDRLQKVSEREAADEKLNADPAFQHLQTIFHLNK
ncbi:MAG: DNA polymerase III subunit gamma/tau [Legionella sp.]|jgi:DNA polymerase-3 subunit gamma/tau|nr:DNA polymerase III subunit gamma/tau [Legionella sp.]